MDYLFVLIAILAGIILGMITGLIPGIHINLISSIIIAYSYKILQILDPITIIITITSMAITHTTLDIIPTSLIGIPSTENLNEILPAHALTSKGQSLTAISYGLIGNIVGVLSTTIAIPLLVKIIPIIYIEIKEHIGIILLIITTIIAFNNKNKILSLLFLLGSGVLGILSFNIQTINQPLLPLLSGLFGLSALLLSINNKTKLPEQAKDIKINISKIQILRYSITTSLASFLTNFLPGLTSSHTALMSNKLSKVKNQEEYIILSNASSSSATIIGFIALYTIEKSRSGTVAAIEHLIASLNQTNLILIIAVSLITISLSTIFAIFLSKKIIKYCNKINYKKLNIIIISTIIFLALVITKLEGLIILITSTSFGILAQKLNIEKINLTGCLIIPVILYMF